MNCVRKIVNVFLAMTILVATTGVTLNKHYCMGRLKAMAINESASLCKEKGFTEPMPCCEDISQELKVEEVTQASFDYDAQPDLYQIAIITFVLSEQSYSDLSEEITFQDYSSPPIDRDIPVLIQSFLI